MAADHLWQLQEAWILCTLTLTCANSSCVSLVQICVTRAQRANVWLSPLACIPTFACLVVLCDGFCVRTVSCVFALSLPAERHQPDPVSSTLITWFLHNGLAGWNESLCLPEELPSCSESALIQLHCKNFTRCGLSAFRLPQPSGPQRGQLALSESSDVRAAVDRSLWKNVWFSFICWQYDYICSILI